MNREQSRGEDEEFYGQSVTRFRNFNIYHFFAVEQRELKLKQNRVILRVKLAEILDLKERLDFGSSIG